MTAHLSLYFTYEKRLKLFRSEFSSSLQSIKCISYRGKDSSAYGRNFGSFNWSSAVQGLCLLAITSRIENNSSYLQSEIHPLLSSLDFALSKPPVWIQEMFGFDAKGEMICKRIIKRVNPQQKLSGASYIAFNKDFLPADAISIYVNGVEIQEKAALQLLQKELTGRFKLTVLTSDISCASSTKKEKAELPTPFSNNEFLHRFKSHFGNEILHTLHQSDIFSTEKTAETLKQMIYDPDFIHTAGDGISRLSPLFDKKPMSVRLGTTNQYEHLLKESDPIRISFAAGFAAGPAIFFYLKYIKKYPIEFDFNYPYAIALAQNIMQERFIAPPDICVLGSAPAATLLAQKKRFGFEPFLAFPGMTHRVIGQTSKDKDDSLSESEYLLLNDLPSTSGFYLNSLITKSKVQRNKIKITHTEPDEIYRAIRSDDSSTRGVLYFPFYFLATETTSAKLLDDPKENMHIKDSLLFAHESIRSTPLKLLALEIAIRDAWLELREGGQKLNHVLDLILSDNEYLKVLQRYSGLYNAKVPHQALSLFD